jgi:lactoylglutathione lyase
MPHYTLYAVRIFVSDFARARAFYTDTLGMPAGFTSEAIGWVELKIEGARLALERADPDDPESRELVGRFVGVSLRVDDVHAVYAELCAKGVSFLAPPAKQAWGGTLAHLRDPDGNVLTLLGQDR